VMEGVDLYAVGQILGHKTPRMTQRYAHLSLITWRVQLARWMGSWAE
jgi:site-specific recombinase XerD